MARGRPYKAGGLGYLDNESWAGCWVDRFTNRHDLFNRDGGQVIVVQDLDQPAIDALQNTAKNQAGAAYDFNTAVNELIQFLLHNLAPILANLHRKVR